MDDSFRDAARRSLAMADVPTGCRVDENALRRDCYRVEAPERAFEAAPGRSVLARSTLRLERQEV